MSFFLEIHHNIRYIFGLTRNPTLAKRMDAFSPIVLRRYEILKENDRSFTEFEYQAGTWHRKLRVIGMAEISEKGLNIRFVVTNILELRPFIIYEDTHTAAGDKWRITSRNSNSVSNATGPPAMRSMPTPSDCFCTASPIRFSMPSGVRSSPGPISPTPGSIPSAFAFSKSGPQSGNGKPGFSSDYPNRIL